MDDATLHRNIFILCNRPDLSVKRNILIGMVKESSNDFFLLLIIRTREKFGPCMPSFSIFSLFGAANMNLSSVKQEQLDLTIEYILDLH